jgi:phosphatidylglycerol:prolipoprotein diacylglycerol transferase
VHPIAFRLGDLTIHWYGIMIALAFLVGMWTAGRRGLRYNLNPSYIQDAAIWLLVGGIVGARVLHVVTYWEDFRGKGVLEWFKIQNGGLVFYGGAIGAILAGGVFAWRKKLAFFKYADAIAPSIALGSLFGRIGCLMTGCCFGQTCSLPWAIQFPNGSLAWEEQHHQHLVGATDPALPVHPTQLYDALANLLLYLGLVWLYRRKKFNGQIFACWLIGYAILRSAVELFRGDYGVHRVGVLTPAQLVSAAILAAGIALLLGLPRWAKAIAGKPSTGQ